VLTLGDMRPFLPLRLGLRLAPLLLCVSLFGGCEEDGFAGDPVEGHPGLALLELHLATPALDEAVATEAARLEALCGPLPGACHREAGRRIRIPLDTVRGLPEVGAPPLAMLEAWIGPGAGGWLQADLVLSQLPPVDPGDLGVEDAETPEGPRWRQAMGDWGYGIHMATRTPPGVWPEGGAGPIPPGWAPLPLPGGGWIALEGGGLVGWLSPPTEHVWLFPNGGEGAMRAVRILEVSGGQVAFRAELPSDMPCEEPIPPDPPTPPVERVPLADLFAPDGTPRIQVAYPRGC
jgi:hypothetical protein